MPAGGYNRRTAAHSAMATLFRRPLPVDFPNIPVERRRYKASQSRAGNQLAFVRLRFKWSKVFGGVGSWVIHLSSMAFRITLKDCNLQVDRAGRDFLSSGVS